MNTVVSTSELVDLSNLTSGYYGSNRDLVSDSELQPGEGRSHEKVWNNICKVPKSTKGKILALMISKRLLNIVE